MGYQKEISITITIYPDFYKCIYFDYMKKAVNDWIAECFNTYTDRFTLNTANPSGIAQFYSYETGQGEINYHKLWKNSYGSYNIHIEASGEVMNGISDSILPPKELMEHSLEYINVKYMESSKKHGIKIIAFGKENGVPREYRAETPDVEGWRRGIHPDIECVCDDFVFSINVGKEIYDNIFNLFVQLSEISGDETLKLDMDESQGYISLSGKFSMCEYQKDQFFDNLKEIASLIIQDDFFEAEEIKMNFTASSRRIFYIESYYFSDISGTFQKRSLLI